MRASVIFNPTAGRDRGNAIAGQVQRNLTGQGMEVVLRGTHGPREAARLAEEVARDSDLVVAIGGDGTINEVTNGLASWAADERSRGHEVRPKLGIVPAGTVNVLALDLGIPFQARKACDVIAAGKTMSLDVGNVNGHRFLLMMGAGIDALTIHNIDLRAKKRFRELAFVGTGVKAGLTEPLPQFLVRVEGREYLATFVVAGNTRYYGGRFGVTPKADPTDGLLDLMLFTGTKRSGLAVFWLEVPTSLHLQNPNVVYLKAKKAELVPLDEEQVVWFQTDGELAGRLPAHVEIEPQTLDLLVP